METRLVLKPKTKSVLSAAAIAAFLILVYIGDLTISAGSSWKMLITVIEGTEVGSLFVLIASLLYYFSGSAPTAVCIGLLTYTGVLATLLRQMYWHRSRGSILLCVMIALTVYEMSLFVTGLYEGLTTFSRIGSFVLTSIYSCLAAIPLYSLIYKIGLIGGNTWKE